ncbi:MAG: DUF3426 domain-containing protein, partial [Pseudomonadota bacterium]
NPETPSLKGDTLDDDLFDGDFDYEVVERRPWWQTLLGLLIILLLLACLVAQYFWFMDRKFVLQHPDARPLLEQFCTAAGCDLPLTSDVTKLQINKHHVGPHEAFDDAVMVHIEFENIASFPQPYPVLEIAFEDENKNAVAMRRLPPEQYLNRTNIGELPPKQPVHVNLEFRNVVQEMDAYGFVIKFW